MLPVGAGVPLGLLPGRLTLSRTWGALLGGALLVGGGYQLQWQVTFRQAPFSEGVEERCVWRNGSWETGGAGLVGCRKRGFLCWVWCSAEVRGLRTQWHQPGQGAG